MSKLRSLLIAGVIVGLAYWLYTPVPDDILEPWKFRQQYAMIRIVQDVVVSMFFGDVFVL